MLEKCCTDELKRIVAFLQLRWCGLTRILEFLTTGLFFSWGPTSLWKESGSRLCIRDAWLNKSLTYVYGEGMGQIRKGESTVVFAMRKKVNDVIRKLNIADIVYQNFSDPQ